MHKRLKKNITYYDKTQHANFGGQPPFSSHRTVTHTFTLFYMAVQAGLLTPLTFARHRLSPLAAFTSSAYFFTTEGSDSKFANFTVPTLKTVLEALSQNVSVNKQ